MKALIRIGLKEPYKQTVYSERIINAIDIIDTSVVSYSYSR